MIINFNIILKHYDQLEKMRFIMLKTVKIEKIDNFFVTNN